MARLNENPAEGAAGLGEGVFPGRIDGSESTSLEREKQAAIAALRHDFAAESDCLNAARCARAAAVKLGHCADDLGLGLYRDADAAF